MRQYLDAKRQYPEALIFFRMGDFYEMFHEDAVTGARALDLTLTSRGRDPDGDPIPMCGVPHHAADAYVVRLVRQGFRVAICEQVESARKARGLVRREVVRVVSPGTLTDAGYLEAREPAFLVAVSAHAPRGGSEIAYGVAVAELSTGEFRVAQHDGAGGLAALTDEVAATGPRELLLPAGSGLEERLATAAAGVPVTAVDERAYGLDRAQRALLDQFGTASLEGFGLRVEEHGAAIRAAGALVHYLRDTQKGDLAHLRGLAFRNRAEHIVIDPVTFARLEVLEGAAGTRAGSLAEALDRTSTPMGGRLLRTWLRQPLAAAAPIRERLDAVEEWTGQVAARARLRDALGDVHDLERLLGRVALGTAGPRDVAAVGRSLGLIPRVRELVSPRRARLLTTLLAELGDLSDVRRRIEATLAADLPALVRDGGAIRDGVDAELDELRRISRGARSAIAALEAEERARTGIASLKVRFNRVFGYYIEVSKPNLPRVPDDYERKQTIANGERFVTPALKEYERKVLGAEERMLEREQELFEALRLEVVGHAGRIQASARSLAAIDVVATLAEVAADGGYTRPEVHEGDDLVVTEGRHPVVERRVRDGFVPNDVTLNASDHQVVVLTGPNMGGKSTYLRQTALVVLMAQAGSFVPARAAAVPIVDRIFARVGASDDIAGGRSTFMMEMEETARILNTSTSRSLVLLDEVGRGTATFDGLSIAWAVAEHLATNPRARPKTLFATHYHELTDLAGALPGVANYHVAAREWRDGIVFLHKVEPGRSDRSYGVQVARLAGLPPDTVARAKTILAGLERDELSRGGRPAFHAPSNDAGVQLGLFQAPPAHHQRVLRRVREVDVDRLTPIDALELLAELKQDLEDDAEGRPAGFEDALS